MKKIMFNDKYGLTKAVIEGRKTQTRRIVSKPTLCKADMVVKICGGSIEERIEEQALYLFREEIAVAQSYRDVGIVPFHLMSSVGMKINTMDVLGWDNKMFVRAELMPHRIRITGVHVEHLQDIRDEDCLKEGIRRKNERYCVENQKGVCFYTNDPKLAFRYLIDKTCGNGTWDSNPFVFVYDFELVE